MQPGTEIPFCQFTRRGHDLSSLSIVLADCRMVSKVRESEMTKTYTLQHRVPGRHDWYDWSTWPDRGSAEFSLRVNRGEVPGYQPSTGEFRLVERVTTITETVLDD